MYINICSFTTKEPLVHCPQFVYAFVLLGLKEMVGNTTISCRDKQTSQALIFHILSSRVGFHVASPIP